LKQSSLEKDKFSENFIVYMQLSSYNNCTVVYRNRI
jgi:hypothetical protein